MASNETREPTSTERKLASVAVEMAVMASQNLHGKPIEDVAAWARRQLTLLGYANDTVGQEWAFVTSVSISLDET